MFGASPIEAWEGAGVVYSYAGSGGVHLFFWISVILCVGTIAASIMSEKPCRKGIQGHVSRRRVKVKGSGRPLAGLA